jgi:hypothetical protein
MKEVLEGEIIGVKLRGATAAGGNGLDEWETVKELRTKVLERLEVLESEKGRIKSRNGLYEEFKRMEV